MGGLESQNFKRNVWGLTGISRGVGEFKPKNLPCEGLDIFWNITIYQPKEKFFHKSGHVMSIVLVIYIVRLETIIIAFYVLLLEMPPFTVPFVKTPLM